MNFIRKYKVILIIAAFALILLINSKVNASTSVSFSYNDKQYDTILPQDFSYYVISYCSDGNFWLNATSASETEKAIYSPYKSAFDDNYHYIRFQNSSGTTLSTEFRYYSKDCVNWTLRDSGNDGLVRNELRNFCFANIDIYDTSGNIVYNKNSENESNFYLEYNENLNSYVIYSKWYCATDYEFRGMNQHYYQNNPVNAPTGFSDALKETDGWCNMEGVDNDIGPGLEYNEEMDKEDGDIDINNVFWRVGLQIVDYGTYYFCRYMPMEDTYDIMRFVILENGNSYTETLDKNSYNNWINKINIDNTINNELKENINTQNSYDYFKVFYTEGYENAFIYTNWFLSDGPYSYVVDYSTDNVNYNDGMNIEEYTSNYDYFRYTLDVFKNSSYYIRLRTYDIENENNPISTKIVKIKIRSIGLIDYDSSDTDVQYMLKHNTIYKFFKNNLGALFFPIDLMFNFYSRLDCIDKVNPAITVPTIREYFTGAVVISGFTYNLDSVLENETFSNVYTIYLNFVDFILFVYLSYHLYKVFKEFVNFGGGII